ncbi:MAG: RNA polymerase sigma factor [Armatimonadetes bacterium]|nr:RNA polymerase sigma factor [Armatimonadota bacterium]
MSVIHEARQVGQFDEDIVLVERVLAGDEYAFQTVFERYHDKVFSIALGVLLDRDEAADAVQEIFTLVFRNLKKFDGRSRFSTWLFRVAVNRSIQQARKMKYKKLSVPLNEAAENVEGEKVDPVVDPDIEVAMASLHPADRAMLTLFYWDELSLLEIAESLGCSPNAAKTRLFRARERFRMQYEEVAGSA